MRTLLIFLLTFVLSGLASAASVTLAWDVHTDLDVVAYRLYVGTAPRAYTGSVYIPGRSNTTHTFNNLTLGTRYYFAATGVNGLGVESGYSEEVSYTPAAPTPISTATPSPIPTLTPSPTLPPATATPSPTATATPPPPTPTPEPTSSPSSTPYDTPTPTATIVPTPEPTASAEPPTPTPEPTVTPEPTETPSPTPTPTQFVSIGGQVKTCATSAPVAGVRVNLSGSFTDSTLTDANGEYRFAVALGGSYLVQIDALPRLTFANSGITLLDVLAIQRATVWDYTNLLCPVAADVTENGLITTHDVISAQRFMLGYSTGIGSAGIRFSQPTSRVLEDLTFGHLMEDFTIVTIGDVR